MLPTPALTLHSCLRAVQPAFQVPELYIFSICTMHWTAPSFFLALMHAAATQTITLPSQAVAAEPSAVFPQSSRLQPFCH